jgi:hypothetical protein
MMNLQSTMIISLLYITIWKMKHLSTMIISLFYITILEDETSINHDYFAALTQILEEIKIEASFIHTKTNISHLSANWTLAFILYILIHHCVDFLDPWRMYLFRLQFRPGL